MQPQPAVQFFPTNHNRVSINGHAFLASILLDTTAFVSDTIRSTAEQFRPILITISV